MIVEKQNNAAGVQFKMLTMRERSLFLIDMEREGGENTVEQCEKASSIVANFTLYTN